MTAGSAGVTRPDRSRAVTTRAVMPGSRWVDQPPLASCRGRRNATPRSISFAAEAGSAAAPLALAGSSPASVRAGRPPSKAIPPRICPPRPRNRRRVVVAGVIRSSSFLRGSALVGSITGRARQVPEGGPAAPIPIPIPGTLASLAPIIATRRACRPGCGEIVMSCVGWPSRPNWMTMSRRRPDEAGGRVILRRGETMRGRIVAQLLLSILVAGCGSMTVQEYTSQEGRYRVQFPGKPRSRRRPSRRPWAP